jgi:16S rRNA (adenine1518-N6/adenine1519-N6)-dimethyltransferase
MPASPISGKCIHASISLKRLEPGDTANSSMNRRETRAVLEQFGVQPAHGLGQNFLADDRFIVRICELAQIGPDDLVLEIGAGIGALTHELTLRAGRVVAIEIDSRLVPALRAGLPATGDCRIIEADALKIDLPALVAGWSGPIKVAANLPYYITTPLIEKILCELPDSGELVFMVQREAADRIIARPGSKAYSPLAILSCSHGQVSRAFDVPAAAFYPQPHVDSCVIRINSQGKLQISDWGSFRKFLERCFTQRRKTLTNSLKATGYNKDQLAAVQLFLASRGLPADIRAEKLDPEVFYDLFRQIA